MLRCPNKLRFYLSHRAVTFEATRRVGERDFEKGFRT